MFAVVDSGDSLHNHLPYVAMGTFVLSLRLSSGSKNGGSRVLEARGILVLFPHSKSECVKLTGRRVFQSSFISFREIVEEDQW